MPTGNLPASGKKLWESVYDKALKGSCDGDKECAAGSAWKAVKNAGWHKVGGKWTKKANLVEFSLRVERASFDKPTQERRWKAVTSDILDDLHTDNMTRELYEDFISRIKSNELVPEEFRSDYWSGGMPYLSIAHYDDLGGEGVPGLVDSTYIDGDALKARGKFYDTKLGRTCFDALCDDLYNKNNKHEDRVRISIGFLDYSHRHKSNGYVFVRESLDDICPECLKEIITGERAGKGYLQGHLIHYALTRIPINQRTVMEVDKSMAIKTRKDDASTIVGDEEAEKLEELQRAKKGKSDALVTFSDADTEEEVVEEEVEADPEIVELVIDIEVEESKHKKMDSDDEDDEDDDEEMDKSKKKKDKSEVLLSQILEKLDLLSSKEVVESEIHPLDEVINGLKKDFSDAMAMEATEEEKLQLIQDSYNTLGQNIIQTVKSQTQETNVSEQPIVADNSQLTQLANIVENLAQKVDLIVTRMDGQNALNGPKVPEPRSMRVQPFNPMSQAQSKGKPLSLTEIVQRSVGLIS